MRNQSSNAFRVMLLMWLTVRTHPRGIQHFKGVGNYHMLTCIKFKSMLNGSHYSPIQLDAFPAHPPRKPPKVPIYSFVLTFHSRELFILHPAVCFILHVAILLFCLLFPILCLLSPDTHAPKFNLRCWKRLASQREISAEISTYAKRFKDSEF